MNWTLKTKFTDHIILYWDNDIWFANIIEQVLAWESKSKVVVITTDEQLPKDIANLDTKYSTRLDWISGRPDLEMTLDLSNVSEAKSFILFREENNKDSDKFLLAYVMKIKELNPDINIIADITDSKNKKMFHAAWCTSVINTEEISEKLLYRSLTDWVHRLIDNLLKCDDWYEVYKTNLKSMWVWKTFVDVSKFYFDTDINLISIWNDKKEFFYNKDYAIKDWDFAFIVSKERLNEI